MKKYRVLIYIWMICCLCSGCALANAEKTDEKDAPDVSQAFSARDLDWAYDENVCVTVALSQEKAECDSNAVFYQDGCVYIQDGGVYVLSGGMTDGMIIVKADKQDKVQLVLNGVSIHSSNNACIYVSQADKVFITLEAGTENRLSNGGAFTQLEGNRVDGVIFSKDDLTLNGDGALLIDSPAGNGVVSKDDLIIAGGTYEIAAGSHAFEANDRIFLANADLSGTCGKDVLHAENDENTALGNIYIKSGTVSFEAVDDGISASGWVLMEGGSVSLITGGSSAQIDFSSFGYGAGNRFGNRGGRGAYQAKADEENVQRAKGIKACAGVWLSGGEVSIDSLNDCIHSAADVSLSGALLTLSSGDDAVHADGNVFVSSGSVCVLKSYEGIEGQNVYLSGGRLSVTSADDGVNAAGGNDESGFMGPRGGDRFMISNNSEIVISGGDIEIFASGDGVDSNGKLEITGGWIRISGPNTGDTASLDYGSAGQIHAGTFIAAGASMMSVGFDENSTQGTIMLHVPVCEAGTVIVLTDESEYVYASMTAAEDFSCVIISCPGIEVGKKYTLSVGAQTYEIEMESLHYTNARTGGFRHRGRF